MKFFNFLTGETVEPTDWQLALKVGDCYTIDVGTVAFNDQIIDETPPIFGKIVSDEDCEPGYFLVRAYSEWCPEGELGEINICDITRQLTAEEFEAALAALAAD